jgi:hypothetical protein
MAKFRIGVGSDFVLKDNKVGIGSTVPREKLDVAGTVKANAVSLAGTSATISGNGGSALNLNCGTVRLINTAVVQWLDGNSIAASSPDTGLSRQSSGILQVNNGTTGTLRDINLRSLSANGRLAISDTTLAGSGSLSGSLVDLTQTWATSGTPTAIKLNVTDTASNANSSLMDLQVGGISKFKVDKSGSVISSRSITDKKLHGQFVFGNYPFTLLNFDDASTAWSLCANYGRFFRFQMDGSLVVRSTGAYSFSNSLEATAPDLFIVRDAANTLAQRNGTAAQESRIYNTYTNASNYERGFLKWDANILKIGTEALGTGVGRSLHLTSAATVVVYAGGTSTPTVIFQPWATLNYVPNSPVQDQYTDLGSTDRYWRDFYLGRNMYSKGDVELTDSTKGVILKSPNGTRFRITVGDDGALTTTAI